ncbi:hypothetical protein J6590_091071 [Homalodisca vitripennis]|nr:hypothetical protein J6590_091071 [Homalodisca vitripennis]
MLSKTGGNQQAQSETSVEPYREHFGQRFLVRCENIKFRLQAPINGDREILCQVEPYLTTLALYDAKEGRKLTEDFHLDVNHSVVSGLLADPEGMSENILGDLLSGPLRPRQAVFSVSKPHSDIYIVLRIDKILQGSISQVSEPYLRSAKDPRLGLKVHKAVKSCCQRLGKYRMPFAWTARPLFRLYSNELDVSSEFPAIYRQEAGKLKDEELLKILAEYRKPDRLNKLTAIPGRALIRVEALTELPDKKTYLVRWKGRIEGLNDVSGRVSWNCDVSSFGPYWGRPHIVLVPYCRKLLLRALCC